LTLTDSYGAIATQEVTITINPVNDDPVITPPIDDQTLYIIDGNPQSLTLDLSGNKYDVDNTTSELSWTMAETSPTPTLGITYSISGDKITFTPKADSSGMGSEDLTFLLNDPNSDGNNTDTAQDGQGSQTVNFTVYSYPWISPTIPDQLTDEDMGPLTIELSAYEHDYDNTSDQLHWTINNNNPSLFTTDYKEQDGKKYLIITLEPNQNGVGTIDLTLTDPSGFQDSQTVKVTINSVNDLPVISPLISKENDRPNLVKPINSGPWDFNISDRKSDVETPLDQLTWSISPTSGGPFDNVSITGDTITFTPKADTRGNLTFTLTLTDTDGGSTSQTFEAVVGGKPNITKTIPDITIDEDNSSTPTESPISFDVSLSTYEVNADGSSIDDLYPDAPSVHLNWSCQIGNPELISYVVYDKSNDILRFTPIANAHGSCILTFTVTDDDGGSDSQAITLTINPINDNPIIQDLKSGKDSVKTLVYRNGKYYVFEKAAGYKIPDLVFYASENSVDYDLSPHEYDPDDPANEKDSWSASPVSFYSPLSWSVTSSSTPFSVTISGSKITFNINSSGNKTLTFTLEDNSNGTATDTSLVTIDSLPTINSAIQNDSILVQNEDFAKQTSNFNAYEQDSDSFDTTANLKWNYDPLTQKTIPIKTVFYKNGVKTDETLFLTSISTKDSSNYYSIFNLESIPNQFGEGDVTLTLFDSYGATTEVTVHIVINEVNDAPQILDLPDTSHTIQFTEDNSTTPTQTPHDYVLDLKPYGKDVDIDTHVPGEKLTWYLVDSANDPTGYAQYYTDLFTAEITADSKLIIHPLKNKYGSVNVKFILKDAGRPTNNPQANSILQDTQDPTTITITPVNDYPVIVEKVPDVVCNEDDSPFTVKYTKYESDPESSSDALIWRFQNVDTSIITW
jgi:hypothetical protein